MLNLLITVFFNIQMRSDVQFVGSGPMFHFDIKCTDPLKTAGLFYLDFPRGNEFSVEQWQTIYKSIKRMERRVNKSRIFCN